MKPEEIYSILESQYFGDNPHEKEEIEGFQQLIGSAKVFVDVGASLGQYTYNANKMMSNGVIFAIEADPVRYERLKQLAKDWQLTSTNTINVINAAVADEDGFMDFFISNSNISGGIFDREVENGDQNIQWEKITVKSITLDKLLENETPDFIKIDVEGAEYRVIKGAQNILANKSPVIFVEIHPWFDNIANKYPIEVYSFFLKYNYQSLVFHSHTIFTKVNELSLGTKFQYWGKIIKHQIKRILTNPGKKVGK